MGKKEKKYTPFYKKNIIYARLEAYVFSFILIAMVWFDKDVSAIAILLSLAWAGYKMLSCFYINMAKHEHLLDKKLEYSMIAMQILQDYARGGWGGCYEKWKK